MFQSTLHILLSLLLFLSTAGVSVHQHFCNDQLKSIALWTSATPCKADEQSCTIDKDNKGDCERSCCDDEVSFEKADIDLQTTSTPQFTDISDQHQGIFTGLSQKLITPNGAAIGFNALRAPPLYAPSLQILHCTFLC